jgi:hypothetical protein
MKKIVIFYIAIIFAIILIFIINMNFKYISKHVGSFPKNKLFQMKNISKKIKQRFFCKKA